jgi:hypothetical protein
MQPAQRSTNRRGFQGYRCRQAKAKVFVSPYYWERPTALLPRPDLLLAAPLRSARICGQRQGTVRDHWLRHQEHAHARQTNIKRERLAAIAGDFFVSPCTMKRFRDAPLAIARAAVAPELCSRTWSPAVPWYVPITVACSYVQLTCLTADSIWPSAGTNTSKLDANVHRGI